MRRPGILVFALLLVVAIAAVLYFIIGSPDEPDSAEHSLRVAAGNVEQPAPARTDRAKAATRKRMQAILEGKWIRAETGDEDIPVKEPHPGPCRTEADTNGDGKPDVLTVTEYLDEDGLSTVEETDDDADGEVDKRTTWVKELDDYGELKSMTRNGKQGLNIDRVYSDEGLALEEKIDLDGDGVTDITHHNTYDDDGNLVTCKMTSKFFDELRTFTYDSRGNLRTQRSDKTMPDRGEPEVTVRTFTYDAKDNLTKEVIAGDTTDTKTFAYDDNGYRVSETVDRGSDGKTYRAWAYEYDESGNMLVAEIDRDGDGKLDVRSVYSYDCWK